MLVNSEISWSLVVAANDDEVLHSNLLRSTEVASACEIIIERGAPSAAAAYNSGIARATGDLVVFAHQDVFLPEGWLKDFHRSIAWLMLYDPQWGVAGPFGATSGGTYIGYAYSAGLRRHIGEPFTRPQEVRTLDEMMFVIRRSSGLRFDEKLPGFHLYASDICMEAELRKMPCYAISCFVIHNSCGVKRMPLDFWRGYLHLRKKWSSRLPIITPCTKITRGCMPILERIINEWFASVRGEEPGTRVRNPEQLLKTLC